MSLKQKPKKILNNAWNWWKSRHLGQKIILVIIAAIVGSVGTMYGIAQWYIASQSGERLQLGTTFVPSYAKYLGLDPKEAFNAIVDDLGAKNIRLVSYWEDIEAVPGKYDFSTLDWQFQKAQAAGVNISLAIGLRQPRWPECHQPAWVSGEPRSVWYPQLQRVMTAVINRYKNNPSLKSYQLENEYFLKVFGECKDFDRDRLVEELQLVHSLDSSRPTIISRSNNWVGLPLGKPTPDEFGISVYKRVWDRTFTHRYVEYPYPAWYYAFYAGAGLLLTGKNLMIHELQAEPWMPDGINLATSTMEEQNKSMNAERLKNRFEYGRASGMKKVDLWGAEWWYWRKVHFNDPSIWNVAKGAFEKANRPTPPKSFLD